MTGRYISRDPAGYPDGLNNYLYVHNNPINRIDPLGLWDWFGVLDTVLGAAESAGNAVYGAVDSLSMGLSSKVTTAVYGKETTAEIQNSTSYKVGATIEQVAETATGAAGLAKAAAKYGAKAVISQVAKSELKGVVVDKGVDALVDAGVIDEDAAGMAKAMANGIGSGRGSAKPASGVKAGAGTAAVAPEGKVPLGVDEPRQRYQGPWTERDIARGKEGKGPLDMVPTTDAAGRPMPLQLHHPEQLPGQGVHEVSPAEHKNPALHPSPTSRGVTDEIRTEDREAHWKQRAEEMSGGSGGSGQ